VYLRCSGRHHVIARWEQNDAAFGDTYTLLPLVAHEVFDTNAEVDGVGVSPRDDGGQLAQVCARHHEPKPLVAVRGVCVEGDGDNGAVTSREQDGDYHKAEHRAAGKQVALVVVDSGLGRVDHLPAALVAGHALPPIEREVMHGEEAVNPSATEWAAHCVVQPVDGERCGRKAVLTRECDGAMVREGGFEEKAHEEVDFGRRDGLERYRALGRIVGDMKHHVEERVAVLGENFHVVWGRFSYFPCGGVRGDGLH